MKIDDIPTHAIKSLEEKLGNQMAVGGTKLISLKQEADSVESELLVLGSVAEDKRSERYDEIILAPLGQRLQDLKKEIADTHGRCVAIQVAINACEAIIKGREG